MAEETPPPIVTRFFRACVMILGAIVALWLALELLARIWGWLLVVAAIVFILCLAVWAYRYWWGPR